MPTELYRQGDHQCLMFSELCDGSGDAVQADQFLIVDGDTGAIIDPGGNMAYNELYLGSVDIQITSAPGWPRAQA
jgi:flavorubredoxin